MDITDSPRASDADREQTAERLRRAVGDGRLTLVDVDERLRITYAAVTRADLAVITADLAEPAPKAVPDASHTASPESHTASPERRAWLGVSVLLLVIWAATSLAAGHLLYFWPVWPIGGWGVALLLSTWGGTHGGSGRRAGDLRGTTLGACSSRSR